MVPKLHFLRSKLFWSLYFTQTLLRSYLLFGGTNVNGFVYQDFPLLQLCTAHNHQIQSCRFSCKAFHPSMVALPSPDEDPEAAHEADRIMKQLEANALSLANEEMVGAKKKYQPSISPVDPIVDALIKVCNVTEVTDFELLDSRWNGNEAFCYKTLEGKFFVKLNLVEDPTVFMSEAVGLSALAKTNTVKVPKPLHVGALPKVGDIGPGAFMILEWMELIPFGPMRSKNQELLGDQLAKMHLSNVHEDLHQGRFGFPVSNFLALTPLDNTWSDSWPHFFRNRLEFQADAFYKDKVYGRKALGTEHLALKAKYKQILDEVIPRAFEDIEINPSLIHGDLWIGNSGATEDGPCIFDPACFFGHSEFELSIMEMFGGFSNIFWEAYHRIIPQQRGHLTRSKLYQLYHYSNQLNLFGDPRVLVKCNELCEELLAEH